jgi:hypothetical protein
LNALKPLFVFSVLLQFEVAKMADNGHSPTDIITYIGVPLAVLGGTILPHQ